MTDFRTMLAICAIALPAGAFVAGCGGDDGDSSEDPQTVLDDTFNNEASVSSGDLSMSASLSAEGEQGGSFDASLSGPFQSDPDSPATIPQLDWTVDASGSGGGQELDFEGGLVITEDNAFVEYNGETYEVGADTFSQVKDQLEAQAGAAEGADASASFTEGCKQALEQAGVTDTSGCDIDLSTWLTNLTNEGTEDVGGADSIHIQGDANVEQILTDIGNIAAAVPDAAASGFDPSQLSQFSDAVTDASIDVYSTTEENLLSKFDLNLSIDPAAIAGGGLVPIDSVDVGFSVEIADLNQEQTIDAPTDAKPLSDLVGGADLGALGGVPGLGAGGGSGGSGGSGSGDEYLQCLNQATTPDEITACSNSL